MANELAGAVAGALDRPQPLGWGPDPEIERVTEDFAVVTGSVDIAVGQLVCLREALRLHLQGKMAVADEAESLCRMGMVIDRAIGVAVRRLSTRLEEEAYIDSLTGLLNRRALGRDLERELGRAIRYGRPLAVMVADLDGLKVVNDTQGHPAGDERLRAMAHGLTNALRMGDQAYRIGGDEFVVVLPEAVAETAEAVAKRVEGAGSPIFTWGASCYPDDGDRLDVLIDTADHRLLAKRSR